MGLDVEMRAVAQRQHASSAAPRLGNWVPTATTCAGGSNHRTGRQSPRGSYGWWVPSGLSVNGVWRPSSTPTDAVISHQAAAALWGLPGFPAGRVHASRAVGRSAHRSALATLHRTCSLPASHVRAVERIPVTSPARTIFDLAGVLHPGRTERALDNALVRGLVSIDGVRGVTDALARQGRPGSTLMRRLLTERAASYVPPESNMEKRFESILEAAGVPVPLRQCDVRGDVWIGRVDYLDPGRRLVVEIDSDLHHTARLDEVADARRDEALRNAGYQVLRIREHDVWHRPDDVVRRFLAS